MAHTHGTGKPHRPHLHVHKGKKHDGVMHHTHKGHNKSAGLPADVFAHAGKEYGGAGHGGFATGSNECHSD